MGYTAYRAWSIGTSSFDPHTVQLAKQGATLYTIQFGLNMIWMPLFFSMGRPIAATIDIVALTGVVGSMAYVWGQVDQVCGWLLAPYIGWLSFATYLSVSGELQKGEVENPKLTLTGRLWIPEQLGLHRCAQGRIETCIRAHFSTRPFSVNISDLFHLFMLVKSC